MLMSNKSSTDLSMNLFISIDEQIIDNCYCVSFTVHKDRYNKANAMVPLLCIFLQAKFGKCIWEWFTANAKLILEKYHWDPEEQMAVLIEPEDEGDGMDFDCNDDYLKSICHTLNVEGDQGSNGFEFDINFIIDEAPQPKNQYGDTGSVKTFRSACKATGQDDSQDDDSATSLAQAAPAAKPSSCSPSPDSLTIETDNETQATRTITADTKGMEYSLEQMMISHPDLVKQFLAKNSLSEHSCTTTLKRRPSPHTKGLTAGKNGHTARGTCSFPVGTVCAQE
jgi:hypothetical protein